MEASASSAVEVGEKIGLFALYQANRDHVMTAALVGVFATESEYLEYWDHVHNPGEGGDPRAWLSHRWFLYKSSRGPANWPGTCEVNTEKRGGCRISRCTGIPLSERKSLPDSQFHRGLNC